MKVSAKNRREIIPITIATKAPTTMERTIMAILLLFISSAEKVFGAVLFLFFADMKRQREIIQSVIKTAGKLRNIPPNMIEIKFTDITSYILFIKKSLYYTLS